MENLEREPLTDERILWRGRPRQGFYLRQSDPWRIALAIVAFLVIGAVEVGFISAAPAGPGRPSNWEAPIALLPFVLLSIVILPLYFFRDAGRRRSESYLITENRVVVRNRRDLTMTHLDISAIDRITVIERRDDCATIRFIGGIRSFTPFGEPPELAPPLPTAVLGADVIEPVLVFDLVDDPDAVVELVVEQHDADAVFLSQFLEETPEIDSEAARRELDVLCRIVESHGDSRRMCIVNHAGSRLLELIKIYDANDHFSPLHRILLAKLIMASADKWSANSDGFPREVFRDFIERRASEFPSVIRFWGRPLPVTD